MAGPTDARTSIFAELKRRRVFHVAAVYAVVAWAAVQVADTVTPALRLPEWTVSMVILLVLLGFPFAVVMAWAFEVTPDGVKRTRAGAAERRLRDASRGPAYAGVGILVALVGFGAYAYVDGPRDDGTAPGAAAEATVGDRSIAVLPFANMSASEENEYFADGITDDILTNLALIRDLSVISRTSVMRYKDTRLGTPEIARELGVRYILEGSVRRAADEVRITAQLIEAASDKHLWAATYDRNLEDIFAVQTEIAQAIAVALEARLGGGLAARLERAPTADVEAYDLFLHGRDYYYRYRAEPNDQAIALFRQAIERDPQFALAHAWLGSALALKSFNYGGGLAWADSAVLSAQRAVELQPDLGDGHRALGTARSVSGRYAEAERGLERALELNPSDGAAGGNLGLVYAFRGDWARAIRLTQTSLARDPARSFIAYSNLADFYSRLGLLDQAEAAVERSLQLAPDYPGTRQNQLWIQVLRGRTKEAAVSAAQLLGSAQDVQLLSVAGEVLAMEGRLAEARQAFEEVRRESPHAAGASYFVSVLLARTLWETGDRAAARRLLDDFERFALERIDRGSEYSPLYTSLAGMHAIRGDRGPALDWLERAVDVGWSDPEYTRRDPVLADLRGEPRFDALLARMDARNAAMREQLLSDGRTVTAGPRP